MNLTPRKYLVAAAATLAMLVLPAPAFAEYLVPEGNSAVSQYTEGLPSAGGEKSTKGDEKPVVVPAKTLGAGNAKKLEKEGPEGNAAAEVAAETAPVAEPTTTNPAKKSSGKGKGAHKAKKAKTAEPSQSEPASQEGATAVGSGSGGSGGSSGLGSVLAAATGTESGDLGLLLPIVIVAAIAWAVGYSMRQRRHPAPR